MAVRTKKTPASPVAAPDFPSSDWEHILGSLEEGIVIIDQSERITFFNPAAEQITGLARVQVWQCLYTQVFAANPWMVEILSRTFVSGHSRAAAEGMVSDRYRRGTPVRLTCSPIFGNTSAFLGLIVVLHDLSHQKELAADLQQEDRLTQLSVIAAGLAHEIKNPLAGIRGAAQLLQQRVSQDPAAAEYTTAMIREIDRLSSLLTQLLELSTPTHLDLQPLNVHKILTDVLLLERQTITGGIKIVTRFDPSLPSIVGDEVCLARVFRNLIKNGLQALAGQRGGILTIGTRIATTVHILRLATGDGAPEGGPLAGDPRVGRSVPGARAERSGHIGTQRGRFLSIDVGDNGPGIAAEHLSRVFTPFFTTKSQGTGLGLALSQQIVTQHGGTIRVQSAPGQGALFHVYLPVTSA